MNKAILPYRRVDSNTNIMGNGTIKKLESNLIYLIYLFLAYYVYSIILMLTFLLWDDNHFIVLCMLVKFTVKYS